MPYGSSGGGTFRPLNGNDILIRPLRAPPFLLSGAHPSDHEDTAPAEAGSAIGEILVRGTAVTPGYHRKTSSTHTAFEGGYLRTGDIGSLDRDGGLRVLGRCKDFVVRKGRGVLLSDIDAVLARHPAIIECKTVAHGTSGGGRGHLRLRHVGAHLGSSRLARRTAGPGASRPARRRGYLAPRAGRRHPTDLLQSIASDRLQDEIVDALTARKFRRTFRTKKARCGARPGGDPRPWPAAVLHLLGLRPSPDRRRAGACRARGAGRVARRRSPGRVDAGEGQHHLHRCPCDRERTLAGPLLILFRRGRAGSPRIGCVVARELQVWACMADGGPSAPVRGNRGAGGGVASLPPA